MENGWIGVDLDGTLAEYEEWISAKYIGIPVPQMVRRVKKWVAEGKEVRIFTARVSPLTAKHNDILVDEMIDIVKRWCMCHLGFELQVTHEKDHRLVELWDDLNLVKVKQNTGMPEEGMQLRDYFAIRILQGIITQGSAIQDSLYEFCYEVADEMIEQRNK